MRVLLQRVSRASVRIEGREERRIGRGLAILVGVGAGDCEQDASKLAVKSANLRIFPDERGRFDRSVLDEGGAALVVSQFTLYGDCRQGRRPDFGEAMEPVRAEALYRFFARELEGAGVSVTTGEFGADMQVELVNDGPVTLWLDSGLP